MRRRSRGSRPPAARRRCATGRLLAPEMTVERIDALVLSGGSAFGLDAAGGAMAFLAAQRARLRGRRAGADCPRRCRCSICSTAATRTWGRRRPIGTSASPRRERRRGIRARHGGSGYGDDLRPEGRPGLGERGRLARLPRRRAGRGQCGRAGGRAAPGRISGPPPTSAAAIRRSRRGRPPEDACLALKSNEPANTTIAIVATDAGFPRRR